MMMWVRERGFTQLSMRHIRGERLHLFSFDLPPSISPSPSFSPSPSPSLVSSPSAAPSYSASLLLPPVWA